MENFEYSIQLNDRDWAEFYLASEECSLIQAALATAEETLPNDLEDKEGEENRWIRVRVGPGLAPSTASCLSRGAPHGHLLAEEVRPGSKPSAIQGSQSSHVASELLGDQHELPKCAGECELSFAPEGTELKKTGDLDCSPPEIDVAIPKAEFQGQISEQEAMEKPTHSVLTNAGASKGTDGQAREHGSGPLGLTLQHPTNNISQTVSTDVQLPLLAGSKAVCGNPESPEPKNLSVHPTSSNFPSESEGAEQHPETGTDHLQVNVKAEAPPFQEKASLFQGHLAPSIGTVAPSDPLSESHREGLLGSRSHKEENAADLKDEGRADPREDSVHSVLKNEGQVDQKISPAGCKVNLQTLPEEPEASKCPRPAIITGSRGPGTLDQHRDTAALKAATQKGGIEEPCRHLGPIVPSQGGIPSTAQGSQSSSSSEDNILDNSLEGNLGEMTQAYDHFIRDNASEQAEKMQDGVAENRPASDVGWHLPEMEGPEMYEYFFTDMGETWVGNRRGEIETGLEKPSSPGQPFVPSTSSQDLVSIAVHDATHISIPEVYEHFFNNGAQDRKGWKRLFVSMPASEARKALRAFKSFLSKPAHLLRRRPPSPGPLLQQRGSPGQLLVFSPRRLKESRPRPEDLRMAVMSPERPLQLHFTHRDMCLGFVAFASWAVKTSNLQSPDAWKIVLLANFGTFSAISYFRRQIMAKEHGS